MKNLLKKEVRNSNIELLRILSICAIIAVHFVDQSGPIDYTLCANDFLLMFVSSGGRIAVNVFLLIAVWYMTDAKFSTSRILKIYGQLWLFTSLFTIVALLIDHRVVPVRFIIVGWMPFLGRALWFASSYLCLLLFKSFLDIILQWERKKLISFTILFFALMSTQSTLLISQSGFLTDTVWFAVIYLVIGTFKKYPPRFRWKVIYSLILMGGGIPFYQRQDTSLPSIAGPAPSTI